MRLLGTLISLGVVALAGCAEELPTSRVDGGGGVNTGDDFPEPMGERRTGFDEDDDDGAGVGGDAVPGPGADGGDDGGGEGGLAPECFVDLECEGGSVCVDNKCVVPDGGDSGDPGGAGAGGADGGEDGGDVGGEAGGDDDRCAVDSDCALGDVCDAETGKCEPGCRVDRHCEAGEVCLDARCAPAPCQGDVDCGPDEFCDRRDGQCRPAQCTDDADCDAGESCRLPDHVCEPEQEACDNDGLEPNDGAAEAPVVVPGEFPDLTLCAGEEDWFAVELQVGDTLQAHVEYDAVAGGLDLLVLSSDNRPLGVADREGGVAGLEIIAEESDVVRLAVSSALNADAQYRLFVAVTPTDPEGPGACEGEDGLEENDAVGAAAEIAPGLIEGLFMCSGDADWFAIRADAGDTVTALARFENDVGDLDLFLFGPGGDDELDRSVGVFDFESVQAVVEDSGLQLLHVGGFDGAGGPYTLEVAVEPPVGPEACDEEDGFEDNDERASATPLLAGEFADLHVCGGDADWYAVDVCAGGRLGAVAAFAQAAGDLDMRVYGPDGEVLASGETIDDDETVMIEAAQAGVYALEIFGFLGAANTYTLTVSVEGCDDEVRDDAFEENDSADAAADVASGLHEGLIALAGDDDWYQVPVCAGSALAIRAVYEAAAGGELEVQVRDEGAAVLATDVGADGLAEVQADFEAAGVGRVRVRATEGDAVPYALDVEVLGCEEGPRDDGFEDNDTGDAAVPLPPGAYDGLVVTEGDDDWFAVDVCAGGVLGAEIQFVHADGDLDMTVLAPDDRVLGSGLSLNDGEEVSVDVAVAGSYRVRVFGNLGAANEYTLILTVDDAGCAGDLRDDPLEDNDDRDSPARVEPGVLDGLVIVPDDDDWYSVQACAGAILIVDLRFVHADGDLDLRVLSPGGDILGTGVSASDDERVEVEIPEAGAYLVRVFGYQGAGNTYSMRVTLDEAGCAQQPPDDAFEDNDTQEEAAAVQAGETADLVLVGADEDWYSLQACAGAVVIASVLFAHADGDLQLSMLAAGGRVLASSVSETDDETLSHDVAQAGEYALRVWSADGAGRDTPYRLVIAIDEAGCGPGPGDPADDGYEDNDTQDTAADLVAPAEEGDLYLAAGDDDWFAVAVCAGGTLSASITFDDELGDLDLAAHDPDGRTLDTSAGVGDEESVQASPAVATTVYLRVYGWLNAANAYALNVSVDDAECPDAIGGDDAFEDNDTQQTATALDGPGDHADLIIAPGDDDWFAVELCADGVLTATITFVDADGDLDLSLVDVDGAVIDFSDGVLDEESVTATARVATTAYLRVFGWQEAGNTYALSVTLQGCPQEI